MAINFRNIAKRETVISDIMENRTKVDKVNCRYNIVDFDIVANAKGESYAVCAINDREFINGGFVLSRIFGSIIDEYDGDKEKARADFRAQGGITVELKKSKTRAGRDITTVEVI